MFSKGYAFIWTKNSTEKPVWWLFVRTSQTGRTVVGRRVGKCKYIDGRMDGRQSVSGRESPNRPTVGRSVCLQQLATLTKLRLCCCCNGSAAKAILLLRHSCLRACCRPASPALRHSLGGLCRSLDNDTLGAKLYVEIYQNTNYIFLFS